MKDKSHVPGTVLDFMGHAALGRSFYKWDKERKAFAYPITSVYSRVKDDTQEKLDRYVDLLPKAIPGLDVVDSVLKQAQDVVRGYVYFTWSDKRMWECLQKTYDEHGVADTRVLYLQCKGRYTREQPSLPGVPRPIPSSQGGSQVWSCFTRWGLMRIDGAFAHRICHPNTGGPVTLPLYNLRAEVGDEWWLMGTQGDDPETLALEIACSPLDDRTKENLIFNLRHRSS